MEKMSLKIRPETTSDHQFIWNVHRQAFGTEAESNLVDALRDGSFVSVSLVAESHDQVVGHILFSEAEIVTDHGTVGTLSLAPMSVLPEFQRQGIGSQLVRAGLAACRNHGASIVMVLGHPDFYPKFGFKPELAAAIQSPFGAGDAWMGLELRADSLSEIVGRIEYAAPFRAFE